MAQIEKYGITFNSYKTTGVPTDQWPFRLTSQQGPDEDGGIINAFDIDWNGAKPGIGEGENGITTIGELLTSIKGVYSPMFAN